MLGEYHIEHPLGKGQYGRAYLARQHPYGELVVITIFTLQEEFFARQRDHFAGRIIQERDALKGLAHPNILATYDIGEYSGLLYLVTAPVKGASLSQALKQQGRLTPEQTLEVIEQIASGLDHAHSKGEVHGLLSSSHMLISGDGRVQIAGFGLRTILEARGRVAGAHPQTSLFDASGAFLGNCDYIAPECIQGAPVDTRSDIYALGVLLFELLSGSLPFSGMTPSDAAQQRIQQPPPSVHAICPDIPEAFDLVLGKMLESDPAKRYKWASEGAEAFERVLQVVDTMNRISTARAAQSAREPQLTLPPAVNWFYEDEQTSDKWQLLPPVVTGKVVAVSPPTAPAVTDGTAPDPLPEPDAVSPQQTGRRGFSLAGIDPFAWWTAMTTRGSQPAPGSFTRSPQRSPVRLAASRWRRQPGHQDRRQVVKMVATGTAIAGAFAVGAISFEHFVQSLKQAQQIASDPVSGSTTTTQGSTPTVGAIQAPRQSPTVSRTTPKASPTRGAQVSPTAHPTQPVPTPSPTPSHTGTVIGHTSQATNSAVRFTNPADGNGSLLIHLSNGNFVACERACTHAGVPVDYNPGSGKLVCPAHGAVFNPLNGFSHVSGPGNGPLATVTIRVNSDGTITTG
jgi:serine/threonine-protein kinase